MSLVRRSCTLAVLIAFIGAAAVEAVPYASQVRNSTGDTWEFVLNEDADSFTVMRDGGSPFVVNNPTAGRHTFDMAGFSDFEIQVAKDAPEDWTEISDAGNLHTLYSRATGIVVNQDSSSPYFGTVYISHAIEIPSANPAFDRGLGDGIYSLSADLVSVDLANNFAAQTDPDDVALAKKPPNWVVTNNAGSSPWKLTLDDSGNVISSDFSDQNGGFWYSSPDLASEGGAVLATSEELYEVLPSEGGPVFGAPNTNGIRPLLRNIDGAEVHGSILSRPSVTGTVGVDLTVWAIDEDYDITGNTFDGSQPDQEIQTSIYHPLRWDVGAATGYDQPPTVVINKDNLTVDDDNGTPGDETDDFNDLQFTLPINDIGGVIINNMLYEDQFEQFYLTQSRIHGNESGLLIVSEGPNANSPMIEWSSKRFSFDNGLDGNTSTVEEDGAGIQDIFRNIDDVMISEDGSTLYLTRLAQYGPDDPDGDNPILGPTSNAPGGILVIPLDENGLPDLEIDDNGTPGDTSDDFISNIESIPLPTSDGRDGRSSASQVGLDAAGNVYHVDDPNDRLFVFSPGGNTLATTGSDGTFSVIDVMDNPMLLGDADGDGDVDGDDLIAVQTQFGVTGASPLLGDADFDGDVDGDDLIAVQTNFGATSGSPVSAVPEPTGLLMTLTCFLVGFGRRSRR